MNLEQKLIELFSRKTTIYSIAGAGLGLIFGDPYLALILAAIIAGAGVMYNFIFTLSRNYDYK